MKPGKKEPDDDTFFFDTFFFPLLYYLSPIQAYTRGQTILYARRRVTKTK
jgi:hypothetical protein